MGLFLIGVWFVTVIVAVIMDKTGFFEPPDGTEFSFRQYQRDALYIPPPNRPYSRYTWWL